MKREDTQLEPAQPASTIAAHDAWIAAARGEAVARRSRSGPDRGTARAESPAGQGLTSTLAASMPGCEIGRETHRGGQAIVLRAVQRGTGRDVAIKVMRGGELATPQSRARFHREVLVLARLKHPNIVAILDSGSSAGYFHYIMDYVPGLALDEHVRANRLGPREVGALFAKICDAVNAAHLRGIIHRDLKPGNIRVDPVGEPHVLDFGLAKLHDDEALGDSPADHRTLTGQFVGTPPWASPEQVSGENDAIDARTDVYSLGVILYQALTGEFPYRVEGPIAEILNNICHVDPRRPGTIESQVDDELEAIVLTCLRKAPDERYQSAGELGRDLERYLRGEPIEAKRDHSWYLFKKAIRRHRMPAAIVSLAAALVLTVAIGSTVMYRRESHLRGEAEAAGREAARQAQIAQAVNDFLNNDLLRAVKPDRRGRDATIREVVDAASLNIEGRFAGQPLVEAAIRQTLGDAYMELAEWKEALVHAERCLALRRATLGDEARDTLSSIVLVGRLYRRLGRFEDARALFEKMLDAARRALGEEDELTLKGMNNYAFVLQQIGRLDAAFELNRRVLEVRLRTLGPEHEETLTSLNNDAFYHQILGRLEEAVRGYERVYGVRRRVLGPEHPDTLISMHNVAMLWKRLGRLEDAERLQQGRLELVLRVHGPVHEDTMYSYCELGEIYRHQGCYDQSEPALLQAIEIQRA